MASTTLKKGSQGYGYKYTDIAEIHEWLESQGITYYQYIEPIDGNDYIYTVPIINGEEKAPRRGCKVIIAALSNKSNPAQEQGSGITYARRYSLLMAFGLATDDDDAACMTKTDAGAVAKTFQQEKKEAVEKAKISDAEYERIMKQCEDTGINPEIVCEKCHVKTLKDLTKKQYAWVCANWSKEIANGV